MEEVEEVVSTLVVWVEREACEQDEGGLYGLEWGWMSG